MGFLDKVKSGLNQAGESSKEFVQVQKIKMQKSKLEGQVKELYLDLGRIYYSKVKSGEVSVSVDDVLIQKIDETIDTINNLDDDIVSAKGITYCTKCGSEITKGTLFCTNCGQRISEGFDDQGGVVEEGVDDMASSLNFDED